LEHKTADLIEGMLIFASLVVRSNTMVNHLAKLATMRNEPSIVRSLFVGQDAIN